MENLKKLYLQLLVGTTPENAVRLLNTEDESVIGAAISALAGRLHVPDPKHEPLPATKVQLR